MNDPCGVVLYTLQLLDGARWSAMEHSIAVIDPGKDQTASERLCQVHDSADSVFQFQLQFQLYFIFQLQL